MALAGAIEFQLWIIERRGHIPMFREALARIDAGEDRTFFGLVEKDQTRDPIADAYIERFGLLGGTLPARVIKFFETMWSIKVDAARLVAGDFGNREIAAQVIRQDLELMADIDKSGRELARDLRASAEWPFAPVFRLARWVVSGNPPRRSDGLVRPPA